jgi:hypothetical protein
VTKGNAAPRASFRKSKGAEVTSRLFLFPEADEVSAVLFDPHHVKNRPEVRGQSAGSDLILVHNPFARLALKIGQLPNGREFFIQIGIVTSGA